MDADGPLVESPYISTELAWLEFNQRVLDQANDPGIPLLERVRFLAISASNLDEFTTVRLAALEASLVDPFSTVTMPEGSRPGTSALVEAINARMQAMLEDQQNCWIKLKEKLRLEKIHIEHPVDLNEEQLAALEKYFDENIFPLLTPIILDSSHPFPFIPNLNIAIALDLRTAGGQSRVAILPVPQQIRRFIQLPAEPDGITRYVKAGETIIHFVPKLISDMTVAGRGTFRVMRNTLINLTGDSDIITEFEQALKKRRRGNVIRATFSTDMPEALQARLSKELQIPADRIFLDRGLLRLSNIREITVETPRPDLLFAPFQPRMPSGGDGVKDDPFALIRKQDLVLHHPFDSFDFVVGLLQHAAKDPDVLSIKQTLYRTSDSSPIVRALIHAAENGKSVTCMLELKARFDEAANIAWAREMERAGVQVVFGFVEIKTHAKMLVIIRREKKGLVTYSHFGTGNYHPENARFYTDISLLTADPVLGYDAARAFNFMTAGTRPEKLLKLSMSPLTMREKLNAMIDAEIAHASQGRPAQIWVKMNSLTDRQLIDRLYEASQAGVTVELVVRGPCCLRPGVPGLSPTIRVKSIVGRFLEHHRIFAFGDGVALPHEKALLFITSSDWMERNLDRRVELLVPVLDPEAHRRILEDILKVYVDDVTQSWIMQPSGGYAKPPGDGSPRAQRLFMNEA